MSAFTAMKKAGRSGFGDLMKKLETETAGTKSFVDERFWEPTKDKAKNAYAVIRFLPVQKDDSLPWAKVFNHGFKNAGGKWFIENCPTTIGHECPVCAANNELWNTGVDENKKIVSSRKRKLSYIFNIYVVSDPANKESEGKVWLFRAGKKIHDKIMAKVKPEFEGESPVVVWDLWEGADFKLKIKEVEGWPNYDQSEFSTPAPLLKDDKKLEEIWNSQYSLAEFTAPAAFKSFDDLKSRFEKIVGGSSTTYSKTLEDAAETTVSPKKGKALAAPEDKSAASDDETDDALAYFKNLSGAD